MTKVSLHRFAKLPQRFLLALGLGVGILTLGAIAPPPSLTEEAPAPSAPEVDAYFITLSKTVESAELIWQASRHPTATVATRETSSPSASTPANLIPIKLYTPTAACDTYQATTTAIAPDQAIPQIVHTLLTDQTPQLLDFELAGYRIWPGNQGNTITIDFRRQPNATRHFISLSICEQRVLFGSLRETLLQNSVLDIDAVTFTEQGQPIQL